MIIWLQQLHVPYNKHINTWLNQAKQLMVMFIIMNISSFEYLNYYLRMYL